MQSYKSLFRFALCLVAAYACKSEPDMLDADGGKAAMSMQDAASPSQPHAGSGNAGSKSEAGGSMSAAGKSGNSAGSSGTGSQDAGKDAGNDAGMMSQDAAPADAAMDADAQKDSAPPDNPGVPAGTSMIVGVGSWGLRARSADGAPFVICRNPSTGNDHSPDLLRDIGYGAGVFIAVGGDANAMVMRSLDGEHWQEDLHPKTGCTDSYPSSCNNWMGGVAYHDGVWLAGGGNGALMRSSDGGLTWTGVHPKLTPNAIRHMAGGSGRFVAGADQGAVFVTADKGDSWTRFDLWSQTKSEGMRVAHGAGSFIAWGSWYNSGTSKFETACFVSADKGDHWQACDAMVAASASFVHDGTRWVTKAGSGYATSTDGISWTMHTASGVPSELLFDGKTWFGRSGTTLSRGENPDSFKAISGTKASDYRSWTAGIVLDSNVPVTGVPACTDKG